MAISNVVRGKWYAARALARMIWDCRNRQVIWTDETQRAAR
jgi:hypothetical protein